MCDIIDKMRGDLGTTGGEEREAEIMALAARYGMPARQRCRLEVADETFAVWAATRQQKCGEAVLFILRRNGNLILHTKTFYPPGVYRVPSGGIQCGEALLDAVQRETHEETSLTVAVERFLTVIEFEFRCADRRLLLQSFLFLLKETGGELKVGDANERISGFTEVPPSELDTVASRLENVPAKWRDWGRFRAFPHRLAATLLRDLTSHQPEPPLVPC